MNVRFLDKHGALIREVSVYSNKTSLEFRAPTVGFFSMSFVKNNDWPFSEEEFRRVCRIENLHKISSLQKLHLGFSNLNPIENWLKVDTLSQLKFLSIQTEVECEDVSTCRILKRHFVFCSSFGRIVWRCHHHYETLRRPNCCVSVSVAFSHP